MNQIESDKTKFPKQEIRYSAPVEQLLLGISRFGQDRSIRDLLIILGILVILLLLVAGRANIIYAPLAYSLSFLIVGAFGIPALCQPFPKLCWDEESIWFPLLCWTALGPNTKRSWSSLKELKFISKSGFEFEPIEIQFVLDDQKKIQLKLDSLRRKDLEKLINSIRAFAPHVTFNPPLDKLDMGIDTNKKITEEGNAATHTSLWMAELNRIAPTVFVPLDTGDTLQDDMVEVLGQVATGGLAAIYLVKSRVYNVCILKESVLPDTGDLEAHQKVIEMFQREAKILSSLEHPRIVNVYDYFVENDRHYLLMDFIDGSNLRKVINERGIQSEKVVIRWAKEMASILSYLHQMSPPIVHRDFTPDNLILENDGSITLIDFGAANHCLTTVTGTIVGKTSYMPIEQFQGKPNLASDIYAFAKTLQFLLTGKDPEPFSCDSLLGEAYAISRQLDSLLTRCTEDEDKRPDISAVITELETIEIVLGQNG